MNEELRELANRWIDGTADAADAERLSTLLRERPELRDEYLHYVDTHAVLCWKFRNESGAAQTARSCADTVTPGGSRRTSTWRLSWLAVGLAVVVGLVAWWRPWVSSTGDTIAAVLVAEQDATFADRHSAERNFPPGEYELTRGLVHLRFARGADMVIVAPARIEVRDQQHARLESGTVRVVVPPSATGFTVATREADFVDVGTEFGVRVDPRNGTSDLYVFAGRVNVADPQSGKVLSGVVEGESRRYAGGVGSNAPKLAASDFPSLESIGQKSLAVADRGNEQGERAHEPSAEPAEHLLIFAGQSNMEGKGTANTASRLTDAEKAVIPNVQGFYCNALPDKGQPDPWGLKLYGKDAKFWFNWATWSDKTFPAVGGSWQDFAYWRNDWTGAARYEHGPGGEFWYLGLNPGEPWSNAAKFTTGEDVKEFGPEFDVARTLAAARPNDRFYIVKYAPGGTALADQWDLDDTWKGWGAYTAMKQWVDLARASRPKAKVAGFFWLQGESDAINASHAAAYEKNLSKLVTKVRADFAAPNLPVIVAKIHPGHPDRNYGVVWGGGKSGIDRVRAAQAKLPEVAANTAVVETSDLTLLTQEWFQKKGSDRKKFNDGVLIDLMDPAKFWAPVHFDADGIRTIGKRMAAEWLKLHGKQTPPRPAGANRASRQFHFSSTGNDDADGATPSRAWRSLDKLRGIELVPGDEVVLAEGDRLPGRRREPRVVARQSAGLRGRIAQRGASNRQRRLASANF